MKLSLCLVLLFSLSAHSFTFNKRLNKINRIEYYRYLKPQIRSIIQEFYQILRNHHQFYSMAIPIKEKYSAFHELAKIWMQDCNQKKSTECLTQLRYLHQMLQGIEVLLLKLMEQLPNIFASSKNVYLGQHLSDHEILADHTDDMIVMQNQLHQFYRTITYLMFELERSISLVEILNPSRGIFAKKFEQDLEAPAIQWELLFMTPLSHDVQEVFYSFWKYYILLFEKFILPEDNIPYFQRNLKELNTVGHNFYMKVGKSNLKISKTTQNVLTTMQRRWNSILKVILN